MAFFTKANPPAREVCAWPRRRRERRGRELRLRRAGRGAGRAFLPAGVGQVEDGVDTDQASDFTILSFQNVSPPNTAIAGAIENDGGPGGGVDIGDPVFDRPATSRVPVAATFEEIASGELVHRVGQPLQD